MRFMAVMIASVALFTATWAQGTGAAQEGNHSNADSRRD